MTNEKLVQQIKEGQNVRVNMEQLYTQNLPILRHIASKYVGFAEFEDLMQQAYLAVTDAVKNYQPEKSMFVSWLDLVFRQNINEYLSITGQTVRVPVHTRHQLKIYHRLLGQGLSMGEIAEEMEISYERVKVLASLDAGILSLDAEIGEGLTGIETIAAPETEKKPDLSEVWGVVSDSLDVKRAQIIYDLYHEGISLREEAEKMGVSHQAIEQQQQKAFFRLRQIRKIRSLAEQIDIDIYGRCGVGYFKRSHTSSVEFAVIHRDKIRRAEEACHEQWLREFEQKKAAFYQEYGIK